MGNDQKNTKPNCGTVFFIILLLVFALIYSDKPVKQTSRYYGFSAQNELALGNGSHQFDATISDALRLPDLYKFSVNSLHNTSLNQFTLQYNISGYNQCVSRNFTHNQKTTLEIEPLFLRRLLYHLSFSEKEDLPFLS
jgi:hypothetical protein